MRKKALIAQNLEFFEQLEALRADITAKDRKIKDLTREIDELKSKAEKEKPPATVPLKKLEEKVVNNAKCTPEVEYASEVIGRLVVESASGSNALTAGGNTEHRELVNLLLGKTEVAKAEILSIVSSDAELEEKKSKIDEVAAQASDYFGSILGQLN